MHQTILFDCDKMELEQDGTSYCKNLLGSTVLKKTRCKLLFSFENLLKSTFCLMMKTLIKLIKKIY